MIKHARAIKPTRCTLVTDDKIMEQVSRFKYLRIDLSNSEDVANEVLNSNQSTNVARLAECMRDVVWSNKSLKVDGIQGSNI